MKKRDILLCLAAILLLCLTACGEKQPEHTHKWESANCSRGEFCFSCGKTRGEALTHIWVDATCDKAKHCTLCGKSEGNMLEHSSDGNGVCAICKRALNQVANLDLLDMQTIRNTYDGVIVRLPFVGTENPRSTGYLKDFEIYDQSGTLVARGGGFPSMIPVYDDFGTCNTYLGSDFIPLQPGAYLIKYRAYNSMFKDYVDEHGNRMYYVPSDENQENESLKEALRGAREYFFHTDSLVEGSAPLVVH